MCIIHIKYTNQKVNGIIVFSLIDPQYLSIIVFFTLMFFIPEAQHINALASVAAIECTY